MPLQLWLPLMDNLDNQGLNDLVTAKVQTGVSQSSDGKLGKCYKNTGTTKSVATAVKFSADTFSLCAWVRIDSRNNNWCRAVGLYGSDGYMGLACEHTNGTGLGFHYYKTIDGTNTSIFDAYPITSDNGVWVHYVMCYDGTKYYIYKNGTLVTSANVNRSNIRAEMTTMYLFGGTGSAYSSCSINDVRLYDHALSPKEVKLLSQGLVAHYTLGDSYLEGTTNLCTTSDCLSATCYNGAKGTYGYGTNTDMYKVTGTFNGKFGTKLYMGTSGASARPFPYVSNMFVSNGTNQPKNKTISFDYYGTIGTYINPYKLGSGSATCDWRNNATATKSGTFTNSGAIPVVPNIWNHISFTLTGTTDANAEWGYIILGDTHTSDTSNYWIFANFQIETKDHETGYAGVGGTRNDTTVYDSSGYNYHGTKSGTLTVDSNTPRYSVSTQFSSGSHINTTLVTGGFTNTYTFAWWGYIVNYTGHMMWGFSNGNRLNLYMANGGNNFYWNTGDGNNNPFGSIKPSDYKNAWHYFTVTGDGTTTKLYIDGEFKANATTYKGITGTTIYFNGWDSGTSYNCNGKLSDFRLYSTYLSADDILELYHTSASIDKDGNFYAYELKEVE